MRMSKEWRHFNIQQKSPASGRELSMVRKKRNEIQRIPVVAISTSLMLVSTVWLAHNRSKELTEQALMRILLP
jgi:hypothetical protein